MKKFEVVPRFETIYAYLCIIKTNVYDEKTGKRLFH